MHLEAANYTNALKDASEALNKWERDMQSYDQIITDRKDKGENVSGMVINLQKQVNNYDAVEAFIYASAIYMKALQDEINRLHEINRDAIQLRNKVKLLERRVRLPLDEML